MKRWSECPFGKNGSRGLFRSRRRKRALLRKKQRGPKTISSANPIWICLATASLATWNSTWIYQRTSPLARSRPTRAAAHHLSNLSPQGGSCRNSMFLERKKGVVVGMKGKSYEYSGVFKVRRWIVQPSRQIIFSCFEFRGRWHSQIFQRRTHVAIVNVPLLDISSAGLASW